MENVQAVPSLLSQDSCCTQFGTPALDAAEVVTIAVLRASNVVTDITKTLLRLELSFSDIHDSLPQTARYTNRFRGKFQRGFGLNRIAVLPFGRTKLVRSAYPMSASMLRCLRVVLWLNPTQREHVSAVIPCGRCRRVFHTISVAGDVVLMFLVPPYGVFQAFYHGDIQSNRALNLSLDQIGPPLT